MNTPSAAKEALQPLTLAVHSLPDPADPAVLHAPARGGWKALLIVLACSLPFIVAYSVFFIVQPHGKAHYGQLIDPPHAMPEQAASTLGGQPFALAQLQKQWLLVSVLPAACDAPCAQALFTQRQLYEMLGKDKDRVDRVWLLPAGEAGQALRAAVQPGQGGETLEGMESGKKAPGLAALARGAMLLQVEPAVWQSWLGLQAATSAPQDLYVVDPQGYAMMRLPAFANTQGAREAKRDLDRLLKATAAWDAPGRGESRP